LFLTINTSLPAQEAARNVILGNWLVQDRDAIVNIYESGDRFEGKIVWLKTPLNKQGTPMKDTNNVDKILRKRPALGLAILHGFAYTKDGSWENGTVYDPKNGKTYSCRITAVNKNQLEIRGYIGIALMGRTEIWNRK
jgi:uncharacterized protein (DUF2147 family)